MKFNMLTVFSTQRGVKCHLFRRNRCSIEEAAANNSFQTSALEVGVKGQHLRGRYVQISRQSYFSV